MKGSASAMMGGSRAVRWALFAVATALVAAALPGAALARTVDGGWQPIGVQTCGTSAPACDAVYSRTVTTAGLLRARYRAPADHVGPVRITFMVDGVAVAASDWVGAGEWAGPFQLGPVSAGQHELTLRAEGQIELTSWAGELELLTNDTEAPLQWNAGDDFVSGLAPANPGPDALGHGGVWGYDGSPSLVRDAGTYTRLAQFTPDWTSAHLAAWHGTELDEGSGIPLPGAAATVTGPRQYASGALAPHEVLLHPFTSRLAVLDWHSPVNAVVAITGGLRDIDAFCGDGIGWQLHLGGTKLAEGTLANGAQAPFGAIDPVTVTAGDHLRLSVDPGAADDRFCDSTAVNLTIRTVDPAAEAVTVSGTANIWAAHADPLTGYGSGGDLGTAPVRLELTGGAVTFPAVTGWISCLHTETRNWDGPDGPCGKGSEEHVSAAGGISAYDDSTGNFPLVGVFLAGSQPLAPPEPLDVSGAEVTAEIAPALGQVFRIGDGRTASSALQRFVPPPGATELFLALPDAPSFLGSPGSYADDAGTLDVSVSGARTSATLRVIKQVVNDDGGAKVAGDFSLHVKGGAADVAGSPQPGSSSGTSYTLEPGTYDVSEDPVAGYAATFSGDCDAQGQVALVPGESKTCTITNDDIAPTPDPTRLLSYGASGYRYMQLKGDPRPLPPDGFEAEGYDDSAWKVGPTPFGPVPPTGNCPRTAVTNWDADSALLVRRHFTVPAGTRDVTVHAALDNDVTVYVNGHNVTGDVDPARSDGCASADNVGPFPVPAAVLHPGTNLLAVRAIDRGGESHLDLEVTGVVGAPDAPTLRVVKQVVNDDGGTKVEGDFSLHVKGGGADVAGSPRPGSSSGTPYTLEPGTYGVSEDPVAGYASTFSADCDASGQVALAPGESKTCTITNDDIAPTLRVIKQVVNDDGGSALASAWTMHIRSGLPLADVAGKSPFAGAESPGVTRTLAAGSYVVSESGGPAGYAASISGDCNAEGQITLAPGESQTCTITNNDIAPALRVVKQVVNDDGGTKVEGDFSLHVEGGGADVAGSPRPGSSSGTPYTLEPGTYGVSEDPVAGYAATFSGDCDAQGQVALAPGESKTCTITNDDIAPTQRRLTVVIVGSGTVTLPPDGLVCSTTCNKEYADGDVITITAQPAPGWRFKEWSGGGACSGQVPACEIRMDDAKSVTATFEKLAHALTVSRDGTGSGHVASAPAGIDCGSDCAQAYEHGTEVTLTATPAADSTFAGWTGGACIGTGACSVSMTQARSVVATFATGRHALTVVKEGNGSGTVTSAPAGIDCGSDCAETYDHDAMVTLTAQADIGSSFFGWSGVACVSGGGDWCTVPMTQARTVTATFRATTRPLRVVKLGVGSGTVTSSPAGIDCGTSCAHDFPTRSTVTLTATADPGSRFVGWLTALECPDIGDCTLTLNVDKTIGAKFEPVASHYNLNVFRDGDGRGTVTSSPPGIDCGGGDCSHSYADGTEVTLTAAPNAGSTFIGWHGACTGTATCTISMGAPREVWATFGLATEPGGGGTAAGGGGGGGGAAAGPTLAQLIASVTQEIAQSVKALKKCGTKGLLAKAGCSDSFTALEAGKVRYDVIAGTSLVARGNRNVPVAGAYNVKIKATKKGRKRLKKSAKLAAKVTLTFTDADGNVAKKSKAIVLKRKK